MENYNLTAELKKIASGITTSDPNTELGNINGNMGNLDTAMQGVATAINGISIPNPGSNIDGVASAITNKSIPDPSSNITAVANAIVAMAGGQDLSDLITILTTMNGNIANLGTNHITDLIPMTGGYSVGRGSGAISFLPNEARYTSYTDTNNIGATDVQGAVDKLSGFNYGNLTINSAYATGRAMYQKFGKVVTVFLSDIVFTAQPPSGSWATALVSNLPKIATMANNTTILLQPFGLSKNPIRLAFAGGGTQLFFHWTQVSVDLSINYISTFTYICE